MKHGLAFVAFIGLSASSMAQTAHAGKAARHKTHPTPAPAPLLSQPSEQGTQKSPLIVEKSAIEQTQDSLQKDEDNKRDEEAKRRDYRITEISLFIGFLQFVLLGGQLWLFFRQTRIMEDSLGEAKRAADAARDSADEARDTARLTQCADVLLELVNLSTQTSFNTWSRISLDFRNYGPTRASNVVFNFTISSGSLGDVNVPLSPVVMGANAAASITFRTFGELNMGANVPDIEFWENSASVQRDYHLRRCISEASFDPVQGRL